jgi:iron complex outermembrane receptor protein
MSRQQSSQHGNTPSGQSPRFALRPSAVAVYLLLAGSMAVSGGGVGHAQAQSAVPAAASAANIRSYNIPAGPLNAVLTRFLGESGILLSGSTELAQGKQSPGVQGNLTPDAALAALLAGTGLQAVADTQGRFVLMEAASGGTLPAVTVTDDSYQETAWGPVRGYAAKRSATATKTDTPIIEIPAAVQVVPREIIEDQKAVNLKDVYENVSGVQQAGNTLNAQTEVLPIIRGFESPALMRNGLRATEAGAVDLVNVERVEVLKGPASILYGALEPGGIVNYVTKRPQAESFHVVEQQVGSFDYRRTSIDSTGPLNADGTLLYRVNLAQTDADSFRDSMTLERTAVAPSLLWRPTDRTELLLDFSYVKEKQPYDTGIPLFANGKPRTSERAFFNDPDLDGRTNEDYYAGYQLSHVFSPTWSVRNQLQFHRAHNRNEALRPRDIQGNNLRQRYQNEDRVDDEVQFVLDGTAKFSTGAIDHALLIGAEYIEQDSDFDRFRVNSPNVVISDDPVVNFNPPANQKPTEDLSQTRWTSVYLQDQLSLLEGRRLKLLLGGRFDDVATKGSANGVATTDIKDRAATGRAGLLYMLSSQHSVYLSASQSFRPQFAFAVDAGGKPLDPETGLQYEAGLKSALLDERLFATLAVYQIEKKNVAVFDQALFNATGQSAYFPGVKERSRGVELDVAGNITSQLKILASYAYTDTEVLENEGDPSQVGEPLGGVALHTGRLWLSYDFNKAGPLGGFGLGGGARYVGESTAQFDTAVKLDPYTVADLSLWYNWRNVKASLNVKNLFDKDYIVRASHTAIAHPGTPRSVFASVSIGF